MSCLKFSLVLGACMLMMGLCVQPALSQGPPPDRGESWDNGPPPGRPPADRGEAGPRRPPRDGQFGPPGPPDMREGPDGDRSRRLDGNRRPDRSRCPQCDRRGPPGGSSGPGEIGPPLGGPGGDRMQPPGPRPRREDMERMKDRDAEMYKAMQEDRNLERTSRQMAEQYRRASGGDQAKIKEKLAEIVSKHFEVRQKMRNLEAKRLQEHVNQIREKIESREKNRKEIVNKRISDLTGAENDNQF